MKVLALTCRDGDTELAAQAHQVVTLPFLQEDGPISTRSFTGNLLALQVLAAWIAANDGFLAELQQLPERFDMKKHQAEVQKAVALKAQHVTFLGNGPFYGLACASSLLMREMAVTPADAMHLLEFRHGNQAAVLPHTLIVGFLSDTLRRAEEDMIREIAVMRGPRMVICAEADTKTKMGTEFVFELGTGTSEMARLILMAPFCQLLAFYTSISKGQNPDRPKNVQPVVKLKEKI
jgi:glucosamine--fructose-6-phosphate aminotransferase (isomerizing)